MIDCTACAHWHAFDWHATVLHRVEGGFRDEHLTERVETCSKGLSDIDDGRTVRSVMVACGEYEENIEPR